MAFKSDIELRQASKDVLYELEMFQNSVRLLQTGNYTPYNNITVYNALLESFVIHTRNLIDFFYPPQHTKKDDIAAWHFYDDPKWWSLNCPIMSPQLEEARSRANKQAAHLTYTRANLKGNRWMWDEINHKVAPLARLFLSTVSPDRIASHRLSF